MGAEHLVMHPVGRHAQVGQLIFHCFHEANRATEIVVGIGRDKVGDLFKIQSAGKVIVSSFDILLPWRALPDPALQSGMLLDRNSVV